MTERVEKKRSHYAWVVLIACCALTAGCGILLQSGGQWFVSVTQELGSSTTEIALYFTICSFCMAVAAPFVGKFLPKANVRVLLTVCYLVCIAAFFAMSQYNAMWQWWVSGALLGLAGAFVFVIPVPIILGNWFAKKRGFAMGLAMSFSGIAAAIINPIAAILIADMGWRPAYMVIAAVAAVIVLPCTVFLVRFKPEDKNLLPYGAEEAAAEAEASEAPAAASEEGVPAKIAYRSFPFWLLFLVCGLFSVLTGYSQLLPSYANAAEMPAIAGVIVTMCMLGSFVGMLGLGTVSDRFGGIATGVLGTGSVLAGLLLLIFSGQSVAVALGGGLFYGISLSLINVVVPILCREGFGAKDFATLYSTLMVAVTLVGSFGMVINTLIIDLTGSFFPAFWLGAILCVAVILGIVVSLRMAKRIPARTVAANVLDQP